MTPDEALAAIKRVLAQSSVPLGDIVTHEANVAREDNRLDPPWVTLQPIAVPRSSPHDTDRVGFETDANGRRVGRIFETTWQVDVQLDVRLFSPAPQSATELGTQVQQALFPFDALREARPFPDGSGGTLDDIEYFRVGEGERRDDLTSEHSIRRWSQELRIDVSDRTSTTEEPVTAVDTPRDGEAVGADDHVVLQYRP
jgi:hypothetical protein